MPSPLRGEIWYADLDPTRGHEQGGRRPVLVVSFDRFNKSGADLVVILPITTKDKGMPWHVGIDTGTTGLRTKSFVLCEAIRSIAKDRLSKRVGLVSAGTMSEVDRRLRMLLQL